MKSLYNVYKTEKDLETHGVILDFDPAQFRVRRAGGSNRRYASVLAAKTRPYQRQLNNGTMSPDKQNDILLEVYFETVVVGWENVTDENGEPMSFTKENFIKLMTDLPDLWAVLRAECDNMKNFQAGSAEEDAEQLKN